MQAPKARVGDNTFRDQISNNTPTGFGIGYSVSKALGLSDKVARTNSIEVGMQVGAVTGGKLINHVSYRSPPEYLLTRERSAGEAAVTTARMKCLS